MSRPDYKTCKVCGRPSSEVGPLSHARLCAADADARLVENITGLIRMENPARDRWRLGMLGSVFPELLDVVRPKP